MSSIESLCLPEMCRTVGGQGPDCQHVSFDLEPHGSTGSKVVLPRKCPDLDLSWVLTGGPRGHWVKGELGETGRGRAEETTPGARGEVMLAKASRPHQLCAYLQDRVRGVHLCVGVYAGAPACVHICGMHALV